MTDPTPVCVDDLRHPWLGVPDRDCQCDWTAYLTAAELGWPPGSKLTLDRETGQIIDEPPVAPDERAA